MLDERCLVSHSPSIILSRPKMVLHDEEDLLIWIAGHDGGIAGQAQNRGTGGGAQS